MKTIVFKNQAISKHEKNSGLNRKVGYFKNTGRF